MPAEFLTSLSPASNFAVMSSVEREVTLFRQFVAVLANVGVHPEQLLQNHDSRSRQTFRPRDVGGKPAVMSFDGDVIFHCALLRRLLSSGPPPMSSRLAEAR